MFNFNCRHKKRPLGMCFFADDDLDGGVGSNDQDSSQSQDFTIPEEYSGKGWVKNFEGKTGNDLKAEIFKSFDSSQSLVGKKASEYLSSVDIRQLDNFEELKNILLPQIAPETQIPENAEGYSLNEILKDENGNSQFEYPQEVINEFSNKFMELKLSKEQGQGLLKMYTDFEVQQFAKLTDSTELDNSLNALFNNNKADKDKCSNLLKEFLSDEDQKFLQETTPNKTIEMFYKLAKGFVSKYDYKETGSPGQRGSQIAMSQDEKDKEFNRLHNEIQELDRRPHSKEEKQKLVDQLVALNK